MVTRTEFYDFLKAVGGIIPPDSKPAYSIGLFGIECDDGWLELIAKMIGELNKASWNREIEQIKEKFGGLCFYTGLVGQRMRDIIMK